MPRSILIVSHFSPPANLVASRRIAGMVRHLALRGHRVTVLTSMASGTGPVDGAARVIRTRDLMLSPLNWRRKNFAAIKGEVSGAAYSAAPSALVSIVVPDLELIAWTPFAIARAVELVRTEQIDCVITSSPPTSVNFVGGVLRRLGIPWVADFRDGWTFEGGRNIEYPRAWQRRLDSLLERMSVRAADVVVAVTPPITEDFRARLSAPAVTITNGFDPLARPAHNGSGPTLTPERFSFVYTGTLAYGGSSPADFLAGIRRLLDTAPELAGRIEVVFAGPLASGEAELLGAPDLRGVTRHVGILNREQVHSMQCAADALVIISPRRRPSVATGKLFEYFSTRKPILVVGGGNVAAEFVGAANAGVVVDDSRQANAIAAAMRDLVNGQISGPTEADIQRYSYERLAEQMERQVELAISRAER